MKTGIIVLSRYNSRRLPGKALIDICGRPVLGHILARLRHAAPEVPVVVATSSEPSDDAIAAYCRRAGVDCHRGALDDVAGRFLSAATERGWDFAVRINGDNLLTDRDSLRAMLAVAATDQFDLVTNVPGRPFPTGMTIEILRTSHFRSTMAQVNTAHDREHVTSWYYTNPDAGRRHVYQNRQAPTAAGLHLALDTPDDLIRLRDIVTRAGPAALTMGLVDIVKLLDPPRPSPWRGKNGPLLIAEIGGNHEGDFDRARLMTEQAIRAGADSVKFQIYTGDSLVSRVESPDRHAHFRRFELTPDQHVGLAQMCRDAGVIYCASVWDPGVLDWIDPWLDFYKIGSGDLTAWPLLDVFAARGKPMLVSTGLATLEEISQTVRRLQAVDPTFARPDRLCLMQCTSMYPIPDQDANLRVMDALRAATGVTVGYSDHTIGSHALLAAAAMGAEVLEFHFTDSREGRTFRDHKVSLTEAEVRALCADIARITAFRGDGHKVPQPSELADRHEITFRRAAYLHRPINAGEVIAARDLVWLRPAHGVDARDTDQLVGQVAARALEPLRALDPQTDLQPDVPTL
jgi:sialic acid synthase SpsE/spore coat polysaccharide biosynthesis protein SpsF (cytidylyltransferase family)